MIEFRCRRQFQALNEDPIPLSNAHVLLVPVCNCGLTLGWPVGTTVKMVDAATQDLLRRRYGWREGKQEFILVLVDQNDHVKLRSFAAEPVAKLSQMLNTKKDSAFRTRVR
jgi:hypothetical protein